MAFQPPNPVDAFSAFQEVSGKGDGFSTDVVPSAGGTTRQSRVRNERPAVTTRNLIHWLIPEGNIVQMYINPQNITFSHRKAITPQRTKAGFSVQYWGEELSTCRLNGTTASSGIEGINVLYDIYRNEQLSLDPYALFLAASNDANMVDAGTIGSNIGGIFGDAGSSLGGSIGNLLGGSASTGVRSRPTLASLALQVEMYWSGAVYRGWFNSFNVSEGVDNLGLFNYEIEFTISQIRGWRGNFLAWHKSATSGPSRSDFTGPPHSFGSIVNGDAPTPQRSTSSNTDIISNIKNSLGGF